MARHLEPLVLLAMLASADARADEPRLTWKEEWPTFRPAEYAFTLGIAAVTPLLIWAMPTPPPGWQRSLLFDDALREAFLIESDDARRGVQLGSDVIQSTLILYPFVIDAGLVSLLVDRNFDVGAQLALIDAEAFAIQGLLVAATKRTIGRVRPGLDPCPEGGFGCRSNSQRRSFISGHAGASFTGAALICLHHHYLPLYGSAFADNLACATGLALAITDGALRIASDEHFATDVLTSGAVGLVAGYVIPWLLHYAPRGDGRLDGLLHLGAIAGAVRAGGDTAFATGANAGLHQWWWWNDEETIGLELAGSGLLAGTRSGFYFREGRTALRWWGFGFGIGPELAYRAEVGPRAIDSDDRDQLAAGASVAFGLLEEETQVVLQTSWLPLGQGEPDLIEASLEVGAFRYGRIELAMRRPIRDGGALFFFSLGGRLPW